MLDLDVGSHRVIAEVKDFTTDRITRRLAGRYGTLSEKEVFGPVRSAFADAGLQLAPFASTGLPLVVVLANPLGATCSWTNGTYSTR